MSNNLTSCGGGRGEAADYILNMGAWRVSQISQVLEQNSAWEFTDRLFCSSNSQRSLINNIFLLPLFVDVILFVKVFV